MDKPNYEEIAKNFGLWGEYIDTDATMTIEEFDEMSVDEKITMIVDIWGDEEE